MSESYNTERLKKQGLLLELQQQLDGKRRDVQSLLGSLSESTFVIDTFDPFSLDGQAILHHAAKLREELAAGNKLKVRIDQLKTELGIA